MRVIWFYLLITFLCVSGILHAEPAKEGQGALQYKPGVVWKPDFSITEKKLPLTESGLPSMTVGADLKSRGKIPLAEAVKRLADLKGLTVSWDNQVDQTAPVDVNINATDDFWKALENLLRQVDYYFELDEKTIVVKYLTTKSYYLNIPILEGFYASKVGGNFLGTRVITETLTGGGGGDELHDERLHGKIYARYYNSKIDLWASIEENLTKLLNLSPTVGKAMKVEEEKSPEEQEVELACAKYRNNRERYLRCKRELMPQAPETKERETPKIEAAIAPGAQAKKGDQLGFYFTIDKPLGIITVTAPNSLQKKVENYLNKIKKEISRQVIIEAKIIEIELNKENQFGVDWENLLGSLDTGIQVTTGFGRNKFITSRTEDGRALPNVEFVPNAIYPTEGTSFLKFVSVANRDFNLFIRAFQNYGNVKVLSSPKLTLINGQGAVLTVGYTRGYIREVRSELDPESGVITYSVLPDSILDGLGFGVIASIENEDEVILHITPVISKLDRIVIEEVGFVAQGGGVRVGLPIIELREMSTMARLKNGQLLIMGGLVNDTIRNLTKKVPVLSSIPVVGNAFKYNLETQNKTELVILIKPEIITL